MNNQLTPVSTFNINNIIYSKPSVNTIPNSTLQYRRVNISTKNADGTYGDLLFMTSKLFSFGVQDNKFKPGEYKMTVCLYNKDGATTEEKEFLEVFDKVVDSSKDYLMANKKELKKPKLTRAELDKLNDYSPIRWKEDEDGNIAKGSGPTVGLKLFQSTKNGTTRFLTTFSDSDTGDELNPLQLLGKLCYVTCIIKIDSIFIGSDKCYFQAKLYEAGVSLLDKAPKSFLRPGNVKKARVETVEYMDEDAGEDDDVSFSSLQFDQ
jgi:hypothetical protein